MHTSSSLKNCNTRYVLVVVEARSTRVLRPSQTGWSGSTPQPLPGRHRLLEEKRKRKENKEQCEKKREQRITEKVNAKNK